MATRSIGLTIVVEHVSICIIHFIDETTIKANIPPVKNSKNPVNSKWWQVQKEEKRRK
jgi:hypothetical protein